MLYLKEKKNHKQTFKYIRKIIHTLIFYFFKFFYDSGVQHLLLPYLYGMEQILLMREIHIHVIIDNKHYSLSIPF